MQTVLLVAEVLVAVALIIVVLLQRSEGGGLGMGGGSTGGGLFSARGAADALTRTTAILAFLFVVICLGLNVLALRGRPESTTSILDTPAPAKTAPATPSAPAVPKPQ
jgi:preprotein translocase subunit SecG